MTAQYHFIEPLDVLFLRGNKLFGDPGSYGESLVPPWPSVAAGAIRTALLVEKGVDLCAFTKGRIEDPELGTPNEPGPFTLTAFHLARMTNESGASCEPLFQLPADLVVRKLDDASSCAKAPQRRQEAEAGPDLSEEGGHLRVEALRPLPTHPRRGIHSSQNTRMLAVLPEKLRGKPEAGFWLNAAGWKKYLAGEAPASTDLVAGGNLWQTESRVGVGLDAVRRRAADGALFSAEAVSLAKAEHDPNAGASIGFLARTTGADLPDGFLLRLGGDGRAAAARRVDAVFPAPDFNAIANSRRCRLVLTAPGIFERGWLPAGVVETETGLRFNLHGVHGNLVCAAVPRAEIVSGFDLAKRMPKPARRVAPTGSVYWLDELNSSADDLRRLLAEGLWSSAAADPARRAEGFNRLAIAAY